MIPTACVQVQPAPPEPRTHVHHANVVWGPPTTWRLILPTPEQLHKAQGSDELCMRVTEGLTQVFRPKTTANECAKRTQMAANYWQDSHTKLLYYMPPATSLDGTPPGPKLVVPERLRDTMTVAFHDHPGAAHMGARKTLMRLRQRFWWPEMAKHVKQHCYRCEVCQFVKARKLEFTSPMYPIVATYPFEPVHIDLVTGLPVSRGFCAILVIIDKFSKWPEFVPLTDLTEDTVWRAFRDHWLLRYGTCNRLVSDNGGQFVAYVWSKLLVALRVQSITTSAYHPAANGQVERLNGSLSTSLQAMCDAKGADWCDWLQWFAFAYRSAAQDSTGMSPYSILFGREPNFPSDLMYGPEPRADATDPLHYRKAIATRLKDCWQYVELTASAARRR